jgi:hypothetical protein
MHYKLVSLPSPHLLTKYRDKNSLFIKYNLRKFLFENEVKIKKKHESQTYKCNINSFELSK